MYTRFRRLFKNLYKIDYFPILHIQRIRIGAATLLTGSRVESRQVFAYDEFGALHGTNLVVTDMVLVSKMLLYE
jgi:hypothetical protein